MIELKNLNNYSFNFLFASISNHMAKRVNWLALIKENIAASAFISGILPVRYQSTKTLKNNKTAQIPKQNPKK